MINHIFDGELVEENYINQATKEPVKKHRFLIFDAIMSKGKPVADKTLL